MALPGPDGVKGVALVNHHNEKACHLQAEQPVVHEAPDAHLIVAQNDQQQGDQGVGQEDHKHQHLHSSTDCNTARLSHNMAAI